MPWCRGSGLRWEDAFYHLAKIQRKEKNFQASIDSLHSADNLLCSSIVDFKSIRNEIERIEIERAKVYIKSGKLVLGEDSLKYVIDHTTSLKNRLDAYLVTAYMHTLLRFKSLAYGALRKAEVAVKIESNDPVLHAKFVHAYAKLYQKFGIMDKAIECAKSTSNEL